jgi:hypothetical protein
VRTVFSDRTTSLQWFYEVLIDCTSAGLDVVLLTKPPSHGTVAFEEDHSHYPSFPATNQRYECNKVRLPSIKVSYTSEKNYVGADRFSVKWVAPTGLTKQMQFDLMIEPPASDRKPSP